MWTVLKRIVGLGAIVLGLVFWGMKGLLIGVVINYWFAYFVNIGMVSKHVGYKWYQQVKDLLYVGIVTIIIALICYLIGNLLKLEMYADGAIKLVIYVTLYLGWSFIFKPEAYKHFISVIPDKFKFITKLKKKNSF